MKRRGLAVGMAGSGISIGILVMSPFAAYLISIYGWRMSYFTLALIGFLVLIPLAFLLRRAPSEVASLPESERPNIVNLSLGEGQTHTGQRSFSLVQAAKTRNFWLVFAMWITFSACIYMIMAHIVPHAIDLGIPPIRAATILSLIGGTNAAARLTMGRVSDSIGRKQTILSCAFLMVGAMLWLVWSSDLWMLYLFAILFGFAWGGFATSVTALIGDTFGILRLGLIMAAINTGWNTGGALGSALAGYIFDINGSYIMAFVAGMLTALVPSVLILFFKEVPKIRPELSVNKLIQLDKES